MEGGYGGVRGVFYAGFWTLSPGQRGQRRRGTSEAEPERGLKLQPACLSLDVPLWYLRSVCLGG